MISLFFSRMYLEKNIKEKEVKTCPSKVKTVRPVAFKIRKEAKLMAILRAELKGKGITIHHTQEGGAVCSRVHGVYEGIVETAGDLALPRNEVFDPGSIMLCLADNSLYIKTSLNQWEEINL